ncbi:ABC transporter ATP-binding protein [Corynebacterium auriscanis]|uniref:ABC transporter ATP-binding protein n=1 Tax=Corynebacterium auriscanis TaxID=99807 RepID=UPI003CEC1767
MEKHRSGTEALKIDQVGQTFITEDGQQVEALRDINLTIPQGQIVTLVGPSGCGKSTLLKIAGGFFPPSRGSVSVVSAAESSSNPDHGTVTSAERVIDGPSIDRGVVFQQPTLFPWLNVRDNVFLASKFSHDRNQKAIQRRKAKELLSLVGLDYAADRFPHELSGGMQQRAQIARVLSSLPETVLMDEPFGALDPFTREQLQAELLRTWYEDQPTILFVTHSVEEAILLGHRVVVMSANPGRLIADVTTSHMDVTNRTGDRVSITAQIRRLKSDPDFVQLRRELSELIAEAHIR